MAIKSDKFEAHCIEMAKIAVKVGGVMDLKNDALQACFATILISGDKHGVFLEPVPKDSKTPVIQPETAAASNATGEVESTQKQDEAAAAKADAQVKDVPKTVTPEMDEGARRTSFLSGIESARNLLNKLGHKPEITPAGLNVFIRKQFKLPDTANLGSLDIDQLEKLVMVMSEKVDTQREKAKGSEKPKTSSETLEDWP